MNSFITKFKQTSYYKQLFEIDEEILLVYIGGSRCFNTINEHSDYDINIITLDGKFVDQYTDYYLIYNNTKVHCFYRPILNFFDAVCTNIYTYTGILTLNGISDSVILYKNPKYEKILDALYNIRTKIMPSVCYEIINCKRGYITDLLNQNTIRYTKNLYFLCLASYYLFNEPLDVDFLKAVNYSKHCKSLSNDYKQKALERLTLCKNYIDQNILDTKTTLENLRNEFKAEHLSEHVTDEYLSKYNFGNDFRIWNPWVGCNKISEACANCYIYPEKNIFKDCYYPFTHTQAQAGTFITVSLRSDFFLEEADHLRPSVWEIIKEHPDLIFLIITKRINRIADCLPGDWGEGYNNVIICATCENQKRADERLPILLNLPVKHRWITCSPLLEPIDLTAYLKTGKIEHVEVTGERDCGKLARPTKYEWVTDILNQCKSYDVRFSLLYLGHNFIMPDGTIMKEWTKWYQQELADSLELFN